MAIDRVPYHSRTGELLHYASEYTTDVEWRGNEPFEAELRLEGIVRGRSSAYAVWLDYEAARQADQIDDPDLAPAVPRYPLFLTDLVELLRHKGIRKGGRVAGTWRVVKRGQNYGLALVPPPEVAP